MEYFFFISSVKWLVDLFSYYDQKKKEKKRFFSCVIKMFKCCFGVSIGNNNSNRFNERLMMEIYLKPKRKWPFFSSVKKIKEKFCRYRCVSIGFVRFIVCLLFCHVCLSDYIYTYYIWWWWVCVCVCFRYRQEKSDYFVCIFGQYYKTRFFFSLFFWKAIIIINI